MNHGISQNLATLRIPTSDVDDFGDNRLLLFSVLVPCGDIVSVHLIQFGVAEADPVFVRIDGLVGLAVTENFLVLKTHIQCF